MPWDDTKVSRLNAGTVVLTGSHEPILNPLTQVYRAFASVPGLARRVGFIDIAMLRVESIGR